LVATDACYEAKRRDPVFFLDQTTARAGVVCARERSVPTVLPAGLGLGNSHTALDAVDSARVVRWGHAVQRHSAGRAGHQTNVTQAAARHIGTSGNYRAPAPTRPPQTGLRSYRGGRGATPGVVPSRRCPPARCIVDTSHPGSRSSSRISRAQRRLNTAMMPPGRTVIQICSIDAPAHQRAFWLVCAAGEVEVCLKPPGFDVDLTVTTRVRVLAEVWRGIRPLESEIRAGHIRVEGPTRLRRAFPSWLLLSAYASIKRRAGVLDEQVQSKQ
jgi:hypothetical protein